MNIIYVSSAVYPYNKNEIDKTAKKKLENNIIKFHNSIINGLANNSNVKNVYSLIGLPISNRTNRKILWHRKNDINNNINYLQVGFINMPIIKQIIISIKMFNSFKKIIKKIKKEDLVVIYDASFVTVIPKIINYSHKKGIKSIGIFADIYDYMYKVDRKSNKSTLIKKVFINKLEKTYQKTNGYVFLTKYMNELINKYDKPYVIMEGIIDKNSYKFECAEKYNNTIIMYAGGLKEEYGVKNLVEAIKNIDIKDISLNLYGNGELENYIKNNEGNKIKYFGLVDNMKILEEERKVTLLVNPRFSNQEYTKLSFPSKIMEYMMSGTPVLTTKLKGIPDEYYNYIYTIEDESIEGIQDSIIKILNLNKAELNEKGKRAKEFVENNKNNIKQTEKIIELIKSF